MLKNFTQKINLNGQSVIETTGEDGTTKQVVAETYTATIDSADPKNMTLSSYQNDKTAYKDNRVQCRLDNAEFEEKAFAIQDELIAELLATTAETTTE